MSDYIALAAIRQGVGDAGSALPGAPVVDARRPRRQAMRSRAAATLRTAASVERRWADRLDPMAGRAAAVRG